MTVDELISDIADFILSNTHYLVSKDELERIIRLHISYGTCCVIHDKEKIVAVARWNVEDERAKVLDAVIDEKYRSKKTLQQLIKKGLSLFPNVKKLGWTRTKYPTREVKWFKVEDLLRR